MDMVTSGHIYTSMAKKKCNKKVSDVTPSYIKLLDSIANDLTIQAIILE